MVAFSPGDSVWHKRRAARIILVKINPEYPQHWWGWLEAYRESSNLYSEQFFTGRRKTTDDEWAGYVAAKLLGEV